MSERNTWVIANQSAAALELIAGAPILGMPINAVLMGEACASAQDALDAGAGVVLTADIPTDALMEGLAPRIVQELEAKGVGTVLVQASVEGRLLAGLIASAFATSALNASELELVDGSALAGYLVFGGTAVCKRKVASEVAVLVVGAGALPAAETASASGDPDVPGVIEPLDLDSASLSASPTTKGLRIISTVAREGETVDLVAATRVVGVGRGFGAQEDLALAQNLAQALGAEVACSRPITESEGWMAKERYVGVSGAVIKPDLYVAVGISGQVQHMVGVSGAKTIVAINKDKNAPVFKHADYGIVGDLYEVLPALSAALSA